MLQLKIIKQSNKLKATQHFLPFVALDSKGKPSKVPLIKAETSEDKKLYDGALRRRQLRLILAGKMMPKDADELKSIFD